MTEAPQAPPAVISKVPTTATLTVRGQTERHTGTLVTFDNGHAQFVWEDSRGVAGYLAAPAYDIETDAEPYPSPSHINYDEDSRWCQDHGHTGLLVGSVCETCDHLVATDPRFAAVLGTLHNPDGSERS